MIQAKARSFANRAVYQEMYTNINAAKFSQKWVDNFMTRYNLVNRRKTTVAQRFPDDYVELQTSFLSYILYSTAQNTPGIIQNTIFINYIIPVGTLGDTEYFR